MTAVWMSVVFPHFLYLVKKHFIALFGVGNVCHSSFHGADVVTCAVDYLLCQLVIAVGGYDVPPDIPMPLPCRLSCPLRNSLSGLFPCR